MAGRGASWVGFVVLAGFAGCVGGDDESPLLGEGAPGGESNGLDEALSNVPILREALDPWGGKTELVLFSGVVDVPECGGPVGQAQGSIQYLANYGTLGWGCIDWTFPEGTRMPEGTGELRFEADASAATHVGTWGGYIGWTPGLRHWESGNRDVEGEPTGEATGAWTFPIYPADWDSPGRDKSSFWVGLWAYGEAESVLRGPVDVTLTAVRDPGWEPRPLLDAWSDVENHTFVAEGVMNLLDERHPLWLPAATESNPEWPDAVVLRDRVPAGATHVTVALVWDEITNCANPDECWASAGIISGGRYLKNDDARGPNWKIYEAYEVPGDVVPENPYVTQSTTLLAPFLYSCNETACSTWQGATVYYEAWRLQRHETTVRIVVDAWKDPADLDALRARLGIE